LAKILPIWSPWCSLRAACLFCTFSSSMQKGSASKS
jgi:hypothetical protein